MRDNELCHYNTAANKFTQGPINTFISYLAACCYLLGIWSRRHHLMSQDISSILKGSEAAFVDVEVFLFFCCKVLKWGFKTFLWRLEWNNYVAWLGNVAAMMRIFRFRISRGQLLSFTLFNNVKQCSSRHWNSWLIVIKSCHFDKVIKHQRVVIESLYQLALLLQLIGGHWWKSIAVRTQIWLTDKRLLWHCALIASIYLLCLWRWRGLCWALGFQMHSDVLM